jgi:hypothetical protein
MLKETAIILSTIALIAHVAADDSNVLVRFKGGIGVQPVSNVSGTPNADGTFPNVSRNIVRGVSPAGPWRIEDLSATVFTDSRIKVSGRGLLLAAGNNIGQNANQRVFATLICNTVAPFVEHNTTKDGVPLELNGDFRIDDTLNPAPTECASPVLLIRSSTLVGNLWFAAGIPAFGEDED